MSKTTVILKKAMAIIAVLLVGCACLSCTPSVIDDDPIIFDAAAFYRHNIVEIVAVGDFGVVKTGTGLIIAGEAGSPIIVANLHVAGAFGGLITVRFFGEEHFVNTDTIINDNIIEVLATSQTLDLCVFKVDYEPTTIYNNLTQPIQETAIVPLSPHQPTKGQVVASFGNANGEGIIKLEGEILEQECQVETTLGTMTLIKTSLPTSDGCSGGAMFGANGELLGLTTFVDSQFSYAIRASSVWDLYNSLQ